MTRGVRRVIDTSELDVGQDSTRALSSTGPAVLDPPRIEPVERPVDPEKIAMLAFMEELVTIRVATSTDPNAEQLFEVWVNGEPQLFKRGQTKTVKRKFVDCLARRKLTTHTLEKYTNADGVEAYRYPGHTGLRYDFQMVRDDHPRGAEWLAATLQEA